jgi:hypothetical protein
VAVPLAHYANSLNHPHQGGPAHHLTAGRFSVHHSPFAHHHRHQGPGAREGVRLDATLFAPGRCSSGDSQLRRSSSQSTPIESASSSSASHPYITHSATATATSDAGPSVKAKRGKYLNFKFLQRFFSV